MKRFTVAIAGLGGRGYHTYAKYQHLFPEQMQIVAIADIDEEKIELASAEFNVAKENCFKSAEEMLAMRLAVMHNLYFYNKLMEKIRDALDNGTFEAFRCEHSEKLSRRI